MDATNIIRQLDPDQIRQRLSELDGERQALMILLRAAQRRKQTVPSKSVRDRQREGSADDR